MTTLLDATVSGPTANSYVASTAEATALLDASANRAAWVAAIAADSVEAERKLLRAARILDMIPALGEQTNSTQAMQYPRAGCPMPSGWWWDASKVPAPAKIAQAEIAAWLASRAATDPDPFGGDDAQNIASVRAGPVSVDFRDGAVMPGPDFLARYIRPFLVSWGLCASTSTVRLTR